MGIAIVDIVGTRPFPSEHPVTAYQLLDFGDGRKLERFGDLCLDRPSPAAEAMLPAAECLWEDADFCFVQQQDHQGIWLVNPEKIQSLSTTIGPAVREVEPKGRSDWQMTLPPTRRHWPILTDPHQIAWRCDASFAVFWLRLTPFGHVGCFPEHFQHWRILEDWLAQRQTAKRLPPELNIISLFAYTGGSSIAMANLQLASAGRSHLDLPIHVTHVEASSSIVQWARQNAELSAKTPLPIRWIAEDAPTYLRREMKRGRRYQGFIIDPPSYGHGPKGQPWKIDQHLPSLLQQVACLASDDLQFILLTAHSANHSFQTLQRILQEALHESSAGVWQQGQSVAQSVNLPVSGTDRAEKRALDAGEMVMWLRVN